MGAWSSRRGGDTAPAPPPPAGPRARFPPFGRENPAAAGAERGACAGRARPLPLWPRPRAGGAAPRVRAGARRAQAACAVRAGPLLAPAAPSLARRASRRALAGSPAGSLARGGRAGGGGAACSSQGSPQLLGSPQRPGPAARRPPPRRRRRHVALPAAPQHLALRAERGRRHPVRGGGRGAARAEAGGLGRGAGCGGAGRGPAAPARRAPCSAPANKAGSEPPAGGEAGRLSPGGRVAAAVPAAVGAARPLPRHAAERTERLGAVTCNEPGQSESPHCRVRCSGVPGELLGLSVRPCSSSAPLGVRYRPGGIPRARRSGAGARVGAAAEGPARPRCLQ